MGGRRGPPASDGHPGLQVPAASLIRTAALAVGLLLGSPFNHAAMAVVEAPAEPAAVQETEAERLAADERREERLREVAARRAAVQQIAEQAEVAKEMVYVKNNCNI